MYTFKPLKDTSLSLGSSKILNPDSAKEKELESQGHFGLYTAYFRGALLRLFGEPLSTTFVAEAAFKYIIEASDESGKKWLLTAYEGPSGPAIGGDSKDLSNRGAVSALIELTDLTLPADFDAIIYDDDTDNTVYYGCKDGTCYYRELPGEHLP